MSLTGLKRFFSWKKAYAIIFPKFQVISSHFDKLPYFTQDFPTNQILDWDLDKGEILKTYKNEFDLLKTIFFMEKGIRDHFCKVSSDLKPFWQVTIFHTRLPHKPNHGLGLKQGWNSEELTKMILTGSKRFFSWKKAYAIIFAKFQVISSHFDKLPYFTRDFPTNQIMDWDLDKGEILKTYKNEFDLLKTIFFMKKGIRDHFCKVSSDLKPFWQVTIFHTRLPQ